MNINELEVFVKVVQTGSFSRAAECLDTDKSYLSRIINKLESKLGVRLLERNTRALHLTEIGRELFERATGILQALDDAEQVIQQLSTEPSGTLKLTCSVEFGILVVNQWSNDFLARYPHVNIEANFTGRLVDLVHEGFDLAIRIGHLQESSLAMRKLGELHYTLVASPHYLTQRGTPLFPEELKQHDLLVFSNSLNNVDWQLNKGSNQYLIDYQARLRVNNNLTLKDAALTDLGIAKLPNLMINSHLLSGQLVQLLPDWTLSPIPVYAIFPSNRYLTTKVKTFIEHISLNFKKILANL